MNKRKTINFSLNINEQKFMIYISSTYILNFVSIERFVTELSVFKNEKNVMWKIGFSRLISKNELKAVYF